MAIPDKIKLEIVTPTRLFHSGEVDEVTVPGLGGALGILPGHAPLISQLDVGVLSYKVDGRETRMFCGWGFVEVAANQVSVLAEKALEQEEIDVAEAKAEKAKAEDLLKSKEPHTDYKAARRLYRQACALLEAAG